MSVLVDARSDVHRLEVVQDLPLRPVYGEPHAQVRNDVLHAAPSAPVLWGYEVGEDTLGGPVHPLPQLLQVLEEPVG